MSMPTSENVFSYLDFKPDYRKGISHLDIFRDFALRYLQKTWDLDLLSYVEHGDNDLDFGDHADGLESSSSFLSFPSWIPRWDRGLPLVRGVAYWLNVTVPRIEINSNLTSDAPTIQRESIIQVTPSFSILFNTCPKQCRGQIRGTHRNIFKKWFHFGDKSRRSHPGTRGRIKTPPWIKFWPS